ncbi:MAG: 5-(carboxyamino)imidazole ribonucleotide synthase [Nanoarchaeota archaeon]|nr:5-(carboxyamino)imidazole ribonucleotide synthase [Nanoarchaeota archaeon]
MISETRIGIIGGGQLGKMMTQAAKRMGFYVTVLDPTQNSPAGQVADQQIVGNFYDKNKIKKLALNSNVITYDIEHIDTQVLEELINEGCKIHPSPKVLEIIQDKLKQKQELSKAGIPIAKYKKIDNFDNLNEIIKEFGLPVVQKTLKEGYDGRAVFVIHNKNDIKKIIKTESLIEEFIDFEKEIAIMAARNTKGEIKCYPVVEMIFNNKVNICDSVIAPAQLPENIQKKATELAVKCVKILNGVGIFGVEMFLTKDKKILVNEIAPRPHNSGHYTIEACQTCQFEQHIRAITGLPLGSTELLSPAVMINIFGEKGHEGPAIVKGVEKILAIPNTSFHFYRKIITKPFRKMGHITILDQDIKEAIKKSEKIKKIIKVIAKNK